MSYVEFYYRTHHSHFPYDVPWSWDASPSASYHNDFEAIMRRMGKGEYVKYRGGPLVRACYEYLAGPEGTPVELTAVLAFLSKPYEHVLMQLKSYQPVFPWLVRADVTEPDLPDGFSRGRTSYEGARRFVESCLAYPEQEERERLATEQAAKERATYAAEVEANIQRLVQQNIERETQALREQLTDTLMQAVIVFFSMVAGFIVGQIF